MPNHHRFNPTTPSKAEPLTTEQQREFIYGMKLVIKETKNAE